MNANDALDQIRDTYKNFNHALLEDVRLGPRREATLILCPLVWYGSQGAYEESLAVRIGAIENFPAVSRHFDSLQSSESEIGFLGLDPESKGRVGSLYVIKIEAERVELAFTFRCRSVTIEALGN